MSSLQNMQNHFEYFRKIKHNFICICTCPFCSITHLPDVIGLKNVHLSLKIWLVLYNKIPYTVTISANPIEFSVHAVLTASKSTNTRFAFAHYSLQE